MTHDHKIWWRRHGCAQIFWSIMNISDLQQVGVDNFSFLVGLISAYILKLLRITIHKTDPICCSRIKDYNRSLQLLSPSHVINIIIISIIINCYYGMPTAYITDSIKQQRDEDWEVVKQPFVKMKTSILLLTCSLMVMVVAFSLTAGDNCENFTDLSSSVSLICTGELTTSRALGLAPFSDRLLPGFGRKRSPITPIGRR